MAVSIVRMFTVFVCILGLLSACGSKPQAMPAPTETSNRVTTISTAIYGAPSLGIVTDATLRVISIDAHSVAARTSLQQDDVIKKWNGQSVTVDTLPGHIAATEPTQTVEMTVQRGSASIDIAIQLQSTGQGNITSDRVTTPTPVPSNLYYF